jgi:hypothetical protein
MMSSLGTHTHRWRCRHEVLEQHVGCLSRSFRRGDDELDLVWLFAQVEGEKRATGLLVADHLAHTLDCLGCVAQVQNQVAALVAAQRIPCHPSA